MARLPRVHLPGVPEHVIQRGNNRQICFVSDHDFAAYVHWLKEYSDTFSVCIHAWVLMSNHVHLLCSSYTAQGISLMMQSVGRQYVRYFNRRYERTGTLWEGRFKSCLIQQEHYLFAVYRYIELNPVRAGMVEHPSDYHWSSYGTNALGQASSLCKPHPSYIALAATATERQAKYRALFLSDDNNLQLKEIRSALKSGMALGNECFKQEMTQRTGRRQHKIQVGRPNISAKN